MSTPVHYDVEAALANFRAAHSAMKLPADAPEYARIQVRNVGVSVELLRMVLSETNRGNDVVELIYAMSNFACEFLVNITDNLTRAEKARIYNLFASALAQAFRAHMRGSDESFITSETAPIPSTRGGHA